MAVFQAYPVKTILNGRAYNASYRLDAGKVCVDSAYGSMSAKAARDQKAQKAQAEKLLGQIVSERFGTKH